MFAFKVPDIIICQPEYGQMNILLLSLAVMICNIQV